MPGSDIIRSMNRNKQKRPWPWFLRLAVALALVTTVIPAGRCATFWTGPIFTYFQPGSDTTDPGNWDMLTTNVALTRASSGGLFNAVTETFNDYPIVGSASVSPQDTGWATGTLGNSATGLVYQAFIPWAYGFRPPGAHLSSTLIGVPAVVHLIKEDIYLSVTFRQWGAFGSGGFTYDRSTPAAGPPPAPTVNITRPAGGAVFAAPANVTIATDASVSGGSVTNVAFLVDSTPVGSVQGAPFNFTAQNLTAGPHALTAIATAAGISATSTVVNITVVAPVAIALSAPTVSNGQFSFSYSANPGLSYVVQNSANLPGWLPVVTNVAAASPVLFTTNLAAAGARFFRVIRLPNPP